MSSLTNRYVTIQLETTYGTAPTEASGDGYVTGECDDEAFSQNFDLMTRADMATYGAAKSVVGTKYSEGDVNYPLQTDNFNLRMLHSAFGADTYSADTPSSGDEQHVLTETTNDATFPSYTVRVGQEVKQRVFTGMVLDSISLSAAINEYVMMSASFVGCGESATTALRTPGGGASTDPPAFSTIDALHFAEAYVQFGSTATTAAFSKAITSVNVEIGLNRDQDSAYALGGANNTYVRAPPPQLREISGSIEFNTAGWTDGDDPGSTGTPTYDELRAGLLLNGDSGGLPAISLLFQNAANNLVRLDIFKVQFESPESNVSGRDTQTMSVNFVGLYDLGDDNAMAECTVIGTALQTSDLDA